MRRGKWKRWVLFRRGGLFHYAWEAGVEEGAVVRFKAACGKGFRARSWESGFDVPDVGRACPRCLGMAKEFTGRRER